MNIYKFAKTDVVYEKYRHIEKFTYKYMLFYGFVGFFFYSFSTLFQVVCLEIRARQEINDVLFACMFWFEWVFVFVVCLLVFESESCFVTQAS